MYLEQLYTMSQPDRDPRMRVIDIAYIALLPYDKAGEAKAGDDAKDVLWFQITYENHTIKLQNKERNICIEYALIEKEFSNGVLKIKNYIPEQISEETLAFDHAEIILEGLMRLRNKVSYTDVAFNLVPREFTLPDLQKVYEVILGEELYKTNFRSKVKNKVVSLEKSGKPLSGNRKAALYQYREE